MDTVCGQLEGLADVLPDPDGQRLAEVPLVAIAHQVELERLGLEAEILRLELDRRCIEVIYLAGPPASDDYRGRAAALVREAGWTRVDPFRRDFRGRTEGHEAEIVDGDLEDIRSCEAVLADFTVPDEGTAMEAWYAHGLGKRVVAYTGGDEPHPWTVYVATEVCAELDDAVRALETA
jgi:nucleoside 2-deoxyribosyltransferase